MTGVSMEDGGLHFDGAALAEVAAGDQEDVDRAVEHQDLPPDIARIGRIRPGTMRSGVLRTPIVAKPCGDRSWSGNYRRLPPSGGCRGKSSNSRSA